MLICVLEDIIAMVYNHCITFCKFYQVCKGNCFMTKQGLYNNDHVIVNNIITISFSSCFYCSAVVVEVLSAGLSAIIHFCPYLNIAVLLSIL